MDASGREALVHQAMDRFVHRVREWKASSGPYTSDRDVCLSHKDGIYRLFRDSGLQPWEFHTMLHRATEYGLVAPELRDLWAEVSTTFLQSFSEHSADFGQPHAWNVPGNHFSKTSGIANGNGAAYGNHWLPANGRSSSAPARPPGLEPKQQGQHHGNSSSTLASLGAGARSIQDSDTAAGSATDQQNSRKQQQSAGGAKQAGRSAAAKGGSAAAANAAARGTGKQQQQQQSAASANGPSGNRAATHSTSTTADVPAGPNGKAGPDLLPNGFIPAWRYDADTMQQRPAAPAGGFAAAAHSGAGEDSPATQQQQQQQQSKQPGVHAAPPAAAGSWEVQEPLDLLPSGLLDDVYDQSDVIVDGPSRTAASTAVPSGPAAADGSSNSSAAAGRSGATAAPGRSGGKQPQGKQQQQQAKQLQQPAASAAAAIAAAPAGEQQHPQTGPGRPQLPNGQQQQPRPLSHDGSGPVVPPPSPSGLLMGGGIFGHQQQQQQQQHGMDIRMNGLLPGMQPRQSLDGALQQQQQYNSAMQQHQARMYQQQQQFAAGLGPWSPTPVGYVGQPFLGMGPMGPVQPPPPPRTHPAAAAGSTAPAVAPPPGRGNPAAPVAAASRAQGRVNYAAVAAAPPQALAAGTDAGSNIVGSYSSSNSSYKGGAHTMGFSAAPGAPVHSTQQQQQDKTAALATDGGSNNRTMPLYHPPGSAAPANGQPDHHHHHHHQQQQLSASPPAAAAVAAAVELDPAAAAAAGGNSTEDAVVPPPVAPTLSNLSLFHTASLDSPVAPAVGGPMSPYPSPLQRSLSTSAGASPALQAIGLAGASGSSVGSSSGLAGMAPMLLPPAAVPAGLGAIGEPVGSLGSNNGSRLSQMMNGLQQQQQQQDGQVKAWSSFGPAVTPPSAAASEGSAQQQQQQQPPVGSLGTDRGVTATPATTDGSSSSAASSTTAATANSVASTPHSKDQSAMDAAHGLAAAPADAAAVGLVQPPPPPPPPPRSSSLDKPQQQQAAGSSGTTADAISGQQQTTDSQQQQQQQPPPPPAKPMTWAQKLAAKANSSSSSSSAGGALAAAGATTAHGTRAAAMSSSSSSAGPRIAPAPLSETQQSVAARRSSATTGQTLLAAAKQQEQEAEAAAAAAVPSYSEAAALDGLDAVTAKAAVTAASRMPLPAKMIQAWRSGLCLSSCIKLLQSQRPDLAVALNDRIKGWLCQDCDRSTAECLVLFVLTNLRRDWHMTAKSPGAFLMGLLQHRAALIGGSGMSRKLLEVARNFPNVAVYIDSDVLQELGDMDSSLRSFIMDEYMCKQRHDWPEGLKFPSQCLLSCMRSIRYADPAVHKAYINLMESRPDLGKAMNGVILYGLCKCDAGTGLAAVKRLSELPADWTSAARVNASAFLYQKVQELCGGHCY